MPRLSAKFTLELSAPCLIAWPEEEAPRVTAPYDGLQVETRLVLAQDWRSKAKDDPDWTTTIYAIELTVSADELDSPPDVIKTPDNQRDLRPQQEYLDAKLPKYQAAAIEISNRVLHFFQYRLFTPLVRPIPTWDQALHNPTWFDADGQELSGGTRTIVAQPVPGLRGELGVRKLTPGEFPALETYIVEPKEPSLAITLLSDAQSAWFEGNLRRAVLELAICTEVLVKRRFFAQASPAGAAFDYLEDKAKVSVRVLELLDAVAEEAFSRSYKKQEPSNYQSIDHLFRCRNKIAHRGELSFRDDFGKSVNVDASRVETWWQAVTNLKAWLEEL